MFETKNSEIKVKISMYPYFNPVRQQGWKMKPSKGTKRGSRRPTYQGKTTLSLIPRVELKASS